MTYFLISPFHHSPHFRNGLFSSGFPIEIFYTSLYFGCVIHIPPVFLFCDPKNIQGRVLITNSLIMYFYPPSHSFLCLRSKYPPKTPLLNTFFSGGGGGRHEASHLYKTKNSVVITYISIFDVVREKTK